MYQRCTTVTVVSQSVSNYLKINDSKTEVILIGSKQQLAKLPDISVKVGNVNIRTADNVRNLGIIFDKNLSFETQIAAVCKKASYNLYKLWQIRKYLDDDSCESLVHAFITSHIDYCNSLYFNLPDSLLKKLQLVQNSAARLVTRTPKYHHISPVLFKLHWLPVKYRINFKILLLTFKCLHGPSPSYLSNLLIPYQPTRYLRSQSKHFLTVPRTKTRFGSRGFYHAAPKLWNDLPYHLRSETCLAHFKNSLKTYLFTAAFIATNS